MFLSLKFCNLPTVSRNPGQPSSNLPELICKIKYQNNLPDIPFDPKFVAYPFDPNRFIHYKTTTLEKNFKWDVLTEQDLGVRIDLIGQDNSRMDPPTQLHQMDEKILEDDNVNAADLKRAEQHNKSVSWLRRNEYISTENTRYQPRQYDAAEAKVGYAIKKKLSEVEFYKDRESQIEAIERSFEAAKIPLERHYSKPNVYPVQELQIFPDYELWRHPCAQVLFDDDPAPKDHSSTVQNEEMSRAIIKGLVDKNNEQFVAYFLPTEDSLTKHKRDEENGVDYEQGENYEFKLTKEYTWSIKSKSSSGYEENYFCIFKDDAVYYNELETRVRLSKRRTKTGKISNTKLSVTYRPFTKQEVKIQSMRNRDLKSVNEEEEEDDDDDDEEEAEVEVEEQQEEGEGQEEEEETEQKEEEEEEGENDGEVEGEENNEEEGEDQAEEEEEEAEEDNSD